MSDPFLALPPSSRNKSGTGPAPVINRSGAGHSERAHSKFSASASDRWFNCPGSVELSEGMPDRRTVWSDEGALAHEVLEELMIAAIASRSTRIGHAQFRKGIPRAMVNYAVEAANFMLGIHAKLPGSVVSAEQRVYLDFIDPNMFGTYDGAVVDYFGTLHVFDYKYGAGNFVSPRKNLQMIFYALGVAFLHHWNFKTVRLWIIQPRVRGYDGPLFWELPIMALKPWVDVFAAKVERVKKEPDTFVEGEWCWWCKAKSRCPLKLKAKEDEAKSIFGYLSK